MTFYFNLNIHTIDDASLIAEDTSTISDQIFQWELLETYDNIK